MTFGGHVKHTHSRIAIPAIYVPLHQIAEAEGKLSKTSHQFKNRTDKQ